jgi:chorismate synthase
MEILGGPISGVAGAGESHGPGVTTIVLWLPAGTQNYAPGGSKISGSPPARETPGRGGSLRSSSAPKSAFQADQEKLTRAPFGPSFSI